MSFFLDFFGVSSTAASFFSSFAIVFASLVAPSQEGIGPTGGQVRAGPE
jgi:hypothetical protein